MSLSVNRLVDFELDIFLYDIVDILDITNLQVLRAEGVQRAEDQGRRGGDENKKGLQDPVARERTQVVHGGGAAPGRTL